MDLVYFVILFPLIFGIISLFIPRFLYKYGYVLVILSSFSALFGGLKQFPYYRSELFGGFQGGVLSLALLMLMGLFGILIALYSIDYFEERFPKFFWTGLCWIIGSSSGVVLADNIYSLILFWTITGFVFGLTIWHAEKIKKKTVIFIAGSNVIVLIGLLALRMISGSASLNTLSIRFDEPFGLFAFICLLIASITKAGTVPFYAWTADMVKDAPIPVIAIFTASLDKMLGIYLLKKIMLDWFVIVPEINFVLLFLGSITIVAGIFMALYERNLKQFLSYHAVAQTGYMILGFGTGTPIGIAGGLLQMINFTIFKQGLFLNAGIVEKETGTSKIEKLGGLFKRFPVTFISFTVLAAAISGIPPLNGFLSKWMIYQGIVSYGSTGYLWVIWLVVAVFGSVLTMVSFVKIIHLIFLGSPVKGKLSHSEHLYWQLPALLILPGACIMIGLLPESFAYPFLESIVGPFSIPGLWAPRLCIVFLMLGIGFTVLIYAGSKAGLYRITDCYMGREKLTLETSYSRVQLNTAENFPLFKKIYTLAKKGYFDVYAQMKRLAHVLCDKINEKNKEKVNLESKKQ